jgi:hypothetical protein
MGRFSDVDSPPPRFWEPGMVDDSARPTNLFSRVGRWARIGSSVVLLACAVACGSSPAERLQEARQALADTRYSEVVGAADAGLAAAPDAKTAWGLELAKLEALARSGDGDAAMALLDRLATEHPDRIPPTQYCATADQLRSAGNGAGAIQILDLGARRHPGDAVIAKLIGDSKSANVDPEELQMLRSLGYVE